MTSELERAPNYTGRELESMGFAANYHRWILETFRPYLGRRVVEVGAGSGNFSEVILETRPDSLTMLEPSANLFPVLAQRVPQFDHRRVAEAHQRSLSDATEIIRSAAPDSILYVNVLEHIEDDEGELAAAHSALGAGGRILIFVPANRWLMGAFDRQLGHYRRYTLHELQSKCRSAGFTIMLSSWFDIMGVIPWWLKYRVLQSTHMEPGWVRLHDRWVVPVSKFIEGIVRVPIGKNIIMVGRK
jgi:SAM-dependent methyltransferase